MGAGEDVGPTPSQTEEMRSRLKSHIAENGGGESGAKPLNCFFRLPDCLFLFASKDSKTACWPADQTAQAVSQLNLK